MPYRLHVIKSHDFLKLDAHGKLDVQSSRAMLKSMAKRCMEQGIDHAMLDVRDMDADLSATDLFTLAGSFAEMGFQHDQRLAVLHRFNESDKADFFAMCASNRGWNVRSFDSFEEAFEWLSSE